MQPIGKQFTKLRCGRIKAGRDESKLFTTESIRLTKAKNKYETNEINENIGDRHGLRSGSYSFRAD
jgi:hypothetical protein